MILLNYLKEIELPNKRIEPRGEISRSFLKEHITSVWDAVEYVYKMPYGRITNRESYQLVLDEKRGSCSAKHALIAQLAKELFIPLKLTLGIFLLTAKKMPKIAPILEHYHLEAIPEAHCYLKYNDNNLDITFPDASDFSFDADLEEEMNITPQQIGLFKMGKHQEFIRAWIKDKAGLNFNLIWTIREQCIQELCRR